MANVIDLINLRFGRLIVKSKNSIKGNRRQVRWNCICDCGNEHIVTGESLRSGKSKSCGCLLKEARHVINKNNDREKAMLMLIYSSLKKRNKLKWNDSIVIDFKKFKELSLSNCFYCGCLPSNSQYDIRYENRNGQKEKIIITNYVLKYNGIDRKDSSKGYELSNVLPCCRRCNVAKLDSSIDDFKNHIIKIYNNFACK